MKFALDTNTISYALRRQGSVQSVMRTHVANDIGVPAICAFESLQGALARNYGRKRMQELEFFLARFTIVPFDWRAAQHAAQIGTDLSRAGKSIGDLDTLIAGTARAHALTLVTHNISEFARVPGLAVVDWY